MIAACMDDGVAREICLRPTGYDEAACISGATYSDARYQEASWNGIQMSQIPTYLAFCLQKPTDQYTLANRSRSGTTQGFDVQAANQAITADQRISNSLANQFIARNTASACAIVALELQIQSSVGSYRYAGSYPHLKGRSELFADTIKNSYLEYARGCEFSWEKHLPIVMLQSCEFARGLSSEGASFPVVFNAKVRFENRRQFADGTGYTSDRATGGAVLEDVIDARRPIMLAMYLRQSLAISPSAALVSSQNISHASSIEILSRQ